MKILGVSHPIPTEYAKRIYNDGKTVFVGKAYLGKVTKGDKFLIYESHGARAFTGWADITFIGKVKTNSILEKFGNKLIVSPDEFKDYAQNRNLMTIIEFENFEKFSKPIKPPRFVAIGGQYIYEDQYRNILEKKD